jgi:hypothetical protein
MEFLQTWAIMPQSLYPLDLRSSSIAHLGGDVYGSISPKHIGTFSYTGYYGQRPNDPDDGYLYTLAKRQTLDSYTGPIYGGDLRWDTPLRGLLLGASFSAQHPSGSGLLPTGQRSAISEPKDQMSRYYGQYTLGNLRIDAEFSRHHGYLVRAGNDYDQEYGGWYTSAAYRINKHLELGTYYSLFHPDFTADLSSPVGHIADKVVTARVDLTKFWNVKIEGHFVNGYGDSSSARGFYVQDNPNGLQTVSNILVVRTGLSF